MVYCLQTESLSQIWKTHLYIILLRTYLKTYSSPRVYWKASGIYYIYFIYWNEHLFLFNAYFQGQRRNWWKEEEWRWRALEFKPDYVLFVLQRSQRLDLTCVEAKSPSNRSVFPKSDLVKIGQEMRWMYNKLVVEGVQNPVVGDILISGYDMFTFKMDMIDDSVYRLTELSKTLIY